jgi:alkylhydroperoxidase family enzyme
MRIEPLEPPFAEPVGGVLERMMPPGIPPIALFRTFAHNPAMTAGVNAWGSYYLTKQSSLPMRTREIVIDRVTARCGCEYEWGVHIAFFAEKVGLTDEQVRSLTFGSPADGCWEDPADRLAIELVDQLHDTSTISDDLWTRLTAEFATPQLLDMMLLAGWYHAISYVARAAELPLEAFATRFADVR